MTVQAATVQLLLFHKSPDSDLPECICSLCRQPFRDPQFLERHAPQRPSSCHSQRIINAPFSSHSSGKGLAVAGSRRPNPGANQ